MIPQGWRISRFVETDLWCVRLGELPRARATVFAALRVAVLSMRRFSDDQCHLRASALTLFTLLSIVPIFAMAFGIAQGFGLQSAIEREALARLAGQEEVARWIMSFARSLLETTQGGLIAGIGVAVLFWTVMKVLSNIEVSLNAIWKIESQRTLGRRISDYLSFMLIAPILLVVSSSLTVMITQQVGFMSERFEIVSFFHSFIMNLLRILPYVVIWVLFTFLYIFMPNTKVHAASAALGGVIAGTLYQIFQAAYIYFQVGVSSYNAVYGSFAALPLFLTWLQASWMIVLLGAEISCAHQNVHRYEFEPWVSTLTRSVRKLTALWIMRHLADRFVKGERCCSADDLSQTSGLPILLMLQTLKELEDCGLIVEVAPKRRAGGSKGADSNGILYQPAIPVMPLTVQQVLDRLETNGSSHPLVAASSELETLSHHLNELNEAVARSPANKHILDL
jgi:membrane protein